MSTDLYRAYREGRLVYVGVSGSALRRITQHDWVHVDRVEIEKFPTGEEALRTERKLIESENPVYNVVHRRIREQSSSKKNRSRFEGDAKRILRDARRRAGLTQEDLAARAHLSQQVVSAYERGVREPTLPQFYALLEAAGFEPRITLVPLD